MNRTFMQKIDKEKEDWNNTIKQLDLIDIFKTLHPTAREHTIFSEAHGAFLEIVHMLDHKRSLIKFKRISIRKTVFFLQSQ